MMDELKKRIVELEEQLKIALLVHRIHYKPECRNPDHDDHFVCLECVVSQSIEEKRLDREQMRKEVDQVRVEILQVKGTNALVNNANTELVTENKQLRALMQDLVDKMDKCKPYIDSAFINTYTIRGGKYDGPNYGEELKRLRAELEAK